MKLGVRHHDLDVIDRHILRLLQENCRMPLAKIGDQVGLSAPSVIERVKKLEDDGVITGYHATVDARRVGRDVTAFIGVSITHPRAIGRFEKALDSLDDVLECHHVTGTPTLLLKVKTHNTSSLEELIRSLRSIEGVVRTETMVVLSTHSERVQLALAKHLPPAVKRRRRSGGGKGRSALHPKDA
jgi:Lrp/AsnC family leucine-responsive transcriptional regulator